MKPAPQGGLRPPAYHHERHPLCVGARNGIIGAEPPHAVREADSPYAGYAGISVRRISGVQLIARVDQPDGALFQKVEESERVVAGHTENVSQAELLQPANKICADGHMRLMDHKTS